MTCKVDSAFPEQVANVLLELATEPKVDQEVQGAVKRENWNRRNTSSHCLCHPRSNVVVAMILVSIKSNLLSARQTWLIRTNRFSQKGGG